MVAVIALFNFIAAAFGSAFIIASHASIGPPRAAVTTARQPPGTDFTCAINFSIPFLVPDNPWDLSPPVIKVSVSSTTCSLGNPAAV